MNTTTRRHPRSLREAFGPYAIDVIEVAGSPRGQRLADRLVLTVSVVALLVLVGAGLLNHYLPDFF